MKTAIVRHILVKDKELAAQLKKKILDGADFTKIAKQHSTCPSAKKGGELGEVKKGQLVAYMGSSGFSTGPHVHYEVKVNGTAVNPAGFM